MGGGIPNANSPVGLDGVVGVVGADGIFLRILVDDIQGAMNLINEQNDTQIDSYQCSLLSDSCHDKPVAGRDHEAALTALRS